jgi:hypothetical protein
MANPGRRRNNTNTSYPRMLGQNSPYPFVQSPNLLQRTGEGYMHVDWQRTELILHDGTLLTFPYADNNIPYMMSAWQPIVGVTFQDCSTLTNKQIVGMSVGEETNQNLTPKQKELLLWHWKLGHCHFGWIQRLASEPRNGRRKILESKLQISTAECPYCAACTLSKLQQRKPPGQIGGKPPPEMQIRAGDLQPGDCVSVDQYVSSVPGRLPNTKGRTVPTQISWRHHLCESRLVLHFFGPSNIFTCRRDLTIQNCL